MKTALITGVTGQDGAYLAKFLTEQNYEVHGVKRRSASTNTERLEKMGLTLDTKEPGAVTLHDGDMTDAANLIRIVESVQPDEIYNLAAQSDVGISFKIPGYTGDCNALGPLRLLEAIRLLHLTEKTRFYQASTSELFGGMADPHHTPQGEQTPFYPRSPYAVAKMYGYWITVNYREAYQIYACNGILFNHESPLRGVNFVSRKITRAVARIKLGLQNCLYLGNLDAKRDWGYAGDYVKAIWWMLQQAQPDDYVIATGQTHTVREFVESAFEQIGVGIRWQGAGVAETGMDDFSGKTLIRIDPRYFRPTEVDFLQGNLDKARHKLDWQPETSFSQLVAMMVNADLQEIGNQISKDC